MPFFTIKTTGFLNYYYYFLQCTGFSNCQFTGNNINYETNSVKIKNSSGDSFVQCSVVWDVMCVRDCYRERNTKLWVGRYL